MRYKGTLEQGKDDHVSSAPPKAASRPTFWWQKVVKNHWGLQFACIVDV